MVKILAALSILNSSCASPGTTEKVAALVVRATCSGASHSSVCIFGNNVRDRYNCRNLFFKVHSDDKLRKSPEKPFHLLMAL